LSGWDGTAWRFLTPPLSNYLGTVDPTVSNDSSQLYLPGSLWYNVTSKSFSSVLTQLSELQYGNPLAIEFR
jgi:hypothetical protein